MRRSTRDPDGDRKTSAVCNCHDLGPLPALGLPDGRAPFLAPAKVPSMKASVRSSFPRSRKSSASARRTRSMVPSFDHSWNRRWHVWYDGYRGGRSFHGAPVRSTQRIPFSTSRRSRRGRPVFGCRTAGSGTRGSSISHCVSVRSTGTPKPGEGHRSRIGATVRSPQANPLRLTAHF
jgi:hypothetical protein